MPFVNQKQRSACYAQKRSAENRGEIPKWNCKEFEKNSSCRYGIKNDGFCKKKPGSKRKSRSPKRKRSLNKLLMKTLNDEPGITYVMSQKGKPNKMRKSPNKNTS